LATDLDIFVYFPKCLAPPLRGNLFHLSRERFFKKQKTRRRRIDELLCAGNPKESLPLNKAGEMHISARTRPKSANKSKFNVLVASLHPLFATANAILGTLTATETIDRIARAGILRIFQRHFASLALVKLLLFILKHIFLFNF